MHSILALMAIDAVAPGVRTVAEVNNPKHEPHFIRASVDELLVTSKVASRLLARSALYPGLSGIITDIVSGGEGSELYRITLPDEYIGQSIDTVATLLRRDHKATLLSVNRGGRAFVNPGTWHATGPRARHCRSRTACATRWVARSRSRTSRSLREPA